jgi:hypothetical protein
VIKDWGFSIATVSTELSMDVGDLVLVAHQNPVQTECVSFIEARIERFQMGQGLPAFTMRSTSDQHIIRGDSGGGIWFNGYLVGNNWKTEITSSFKLAGLTGLEKDEQTTGRSVGVQLPTWLANQFEPVDRVKKSRGSGSAFAHRNALDCIG